MKNGILIDIIDIQIMMEGNLCQIISRLRDYLVADIDIYGKDVQVYGDVLNIK
jgi:hypothetical protein